MARPGYNLGSERPQTLLLHLTAANLEATVAGTRKIRMPQRGKIIGMTLNLGLKGGTHGTNTLDVLSGATSLLGAAFDVAAAVAGTPIDKEGTDLAAAAAEVAKDATISVAVAVSGGSSPTWGCATLQIDYVPLGN